MELNGKRALVVGLGKSGVASALFMKAHGARVTVSDTKSGDELRNEIPVLLDHGITVETGGHGDRTFRGQDLIVVSPGVPVDAPPLVQARSLGETVIGEIELAAQFLPGPVMAITGSNGKTTTTTLAGEIMAAAGFPVLVGGNIGTPAISLAERAKLDTVIVLEVSSFQLETIQTFRPKVAVVLNVTPDHLDRHGTMEHYAALKARLVERARRAVIGQDDHCSRDVAERLRLAGGDVELVSAHQPVPHGWYALGTELFADAAAVDPRGAFADLAGVGALRGRHNIQNALAASACALGLGLSAAEVRAALRTFPGLAHRLEEIGRLGRTLFINDSKATNADSTATALTAFAGDVFWILGGRAKEGGILDLAPLFARIARAYLIGEASDVFAATLNGKVAFERCGTLPVALARAARDAADSAATEPVVLLSPACASYDQYPNFEVRGDHFRALVAALPGIKLRRDEGR